LSFPVAHSRSEGAKPASKDVYFGRRDLTLQITREKAGLATTFVPTEPWGVIMDWVVSNATATIIAFSNGHASIYLSTGGGFIGGGESHESVRNAAKKTVAVAGECQPHTHHVRTSSAPKTRRRSSVSPAYGYRNFTASVSKKI
jgi:hypothetical protein